MLADSQDMHELIQNFSSGHMRRESTNTAKIGLKKYVEEEDIKETMVSRTVRLFTGPDIDTATGNSIVNKARLAAVNFAEWWDSLLEPERSGRAQDTLESRWFRIMSAMVIVVNAIVVTWLTDWSLQHSGRNMPPGFEIVDLAFLLFYALEIALKFYVHRGYFFANENAAWNIFDLILVIFSSFDVAANWPTSGEDEAPPNNLGYMRVFRMFKFAKILRTIRIIAFVRELSMMLESFRQCVIAMFWGLVLLLFLLYVFALVFAQGVASHVATTHATGDLDADIMFAFGSVGTSMLSLYMAVTGGNDWSVYYEATIGMGSFYPLVFLSYTFFFIFALFNILTGVFVERAVAAALPDREELIAQERKKILKQVEDLRALFKALDSDRSGKISKAEFLADMEDDRIVSYMHTLGLDMHDAEHFFDLVSNDKNDKEVDIDTFIEHCMSMKGTATAMDLHKQMVQVNRVLDKLTAWELSNWPELFAVLQEKHREAS
ncbi:Scn8a [Symbiodinium natans]|uniref:Scn8a protein n=1 Tax=Symbiodinium natans TaxID=878477 RepID=A0A812TEV8_9DINO|nr:Scn8a [Symbiodinium natans]